MSSGVVIARKDHLSATGLELAVLQALADIRAVDASQLAAEVSADHAGATLSSHEVVAILVILEPTTGIDPRQRDVLKDCDAQSLSRFLRFLSQKRKPDRG